MGIVTVMIAVILIACVFTKVWGKYWWMNGQLCHWLSSSVCIIDLWRGNPHLHSPVCTAALQKGLNVSFSKADLFESL